MPSWKKLQELGSQIGEHLPGAWTLSGDPPSWMVVLTRTDSLVRVLVDDAVNILVEISSDGSPLQPMGIPPLEAVPRLLRLSTRLRDGKKIAARLAALLELR